MKNTVSEIKISLGEITSKLYPAGGKKKKYSEFEGKATKTSQKEEEQPQQKDQRCAETQ